MEVIPTSTGNQLVVHRPLELSERMIALAAAISIDYGERRGLHVGCSWRETPLLNNVCLGLLEAEYM